MCIFYIFGGRDSCLIVAKPRQKKHIIKYSLSICSLISFPFILVTCGTRYVCYHSFTNSERNEIAVCVEDCCLRNSDIARHQDTCIYVYKTNQQQSERGKRAWAQLYIHDSVSKTHFSLPWHDAFARDSSRQSIFRRRVRALQRSPVFAMGSMVLVSSWHWISQSNGRD